jgi:hypothetical protein
LKASKDSRASKKEVPSLICLLFDRVSEDPKTSKNVSATLSPWSKYTYIHEKEEKTYQ